MSQTVAEEAFFYLNELTLRQHRGRGDTMGAARDRVARQVGIEQSYAKRLWDRWHSMKDASGEAYRRLRNHYEQSCMKHEAKADEYRREREEIENEVALRSSARVAREATARQGAEGARS